MTATDAQDWIKKVDHALLQLDEKPQFHLPNDFPFHSVEALLQRLFKREKIQLTHTQRGWQSPANLFEGLGGNITVLAIDWTPLQTPVYFVLSEQDTKELMGDLLGGEEAATPFFDPALAQGFFHYLALEVLQELEASRFMAPLSPRLGDAPLDIRKELEATSCFVSDISLALRDKTIWGRLFVPEAFRQGWKASIGHLPPVEMSDAQAEKIFVELSLEVGISRLGLNEWKKVQLGDFVLLDRCSYNPDEGRGGVILRLGDEPIFRGRFKHGGIKISDYPLYDEVENTMDEEVSGFDEQDSLEGGFVAKKEHDVDALPVQLTVEVGRCRMNVKELRELSPGNMLELGVSPEQGVDLVVNGKKVGRGELIRMGESLGVRILSF
ncbi:MAG: type III secretion system cytoplasmic ring protein SctQ [Chlamydiales bacterium]|nr:type III secretion system cytoplasmic ring protein SctQ [Chlamydiales bacterium]